MNNITYIQSELFKLQDLKYRDFNSKLIPTVNPELFIGVRTPTLRKFAKDFAKSPNSADFLNMLPHKYYEENNLHAFLIEQISDYDTCIEAVEKFLPYIDNWATCDMMRPKIFKKNTDKLTDKILKWLQSDKAYTVRFGIEMLMVYYLDDLFDKKYSEMVLGVSHNDYYVKMMVAWYFATALAKQYDAIIPYIENGIPDIWVHNKAIQKAIESYRITDNQKEYLRTLKK